MKKSGASQSQSTSELISKRIVELGDWRGETLSRMRKLIKEADPDVVEQWKWMGTPIWSHDGICTGESYKNVVISKGASLKDPARLFNSSLDGKVRRRTGRAGFPHPALASGNDAESAQRVGVTDAQTGQPAVNEPRHSVPRNSADLVAARQRVMPKPAHLEPKQA
jgi:hypothetical protein